jgi:tetratricopeptide (TPR) repeat protein
MIMPTTIPLFSDALDRPEPATRDYSRSLALKPHFQAYYNRGASCARLGMYREAIQNFTESLSFKKPRNAGAYAYRAFANSKLGEQQQALLDFEKGCSLGNEVGCRMVNEMNARQRGTAEKR